MVPTSQVRVGAPSGFAFSNAWKVGGGHGDVCDYAVLVRLGGSVLVFVGSLFFSFVVYASLYNPRFRNRSLHFLFFDYLPAGLSPPHMLASRCRSSMEPGPRWAREVSFNMVCGFECQTREF